jgi:hypothetical protein
MNRVEAPSYSVAVYIAGDLATAREACRGFVMSGLCVTLEPVEYVYTGGLEAGVRVGLINYPRFPSEPAVIWARAEELTLFLIERLHQHSASVVGPDRTLWLSRREDAPSTTSHQPKLTGLCTREARRAKHAPTNQE